jgi:hypothetical protein
MHAHDQIGEQLTYVAKHTDTAVGLRLTFLGKWPSRGHKSFKVPLAA